MFGRVVCLILGHVFYPCYVDGDVGVVCVGCGHVVVRGKVNVKPKPVVTGYVAPRRRR